MTYFSEQQFDASAAALGHLKKSDRAALEAEFYRGLAFFYTGHYDDAEEAFAFVAGQLPLPEVVNDQGVAASRRGHDGGALFQEAINGDPHDPDYQFNLAIALARRGDTRNALSAVTEALKLRPQDSEAINLQNMLRQPNPPAANVQTVKPATVVPASQQRDVYTGTTAQDSPSLPLERIKRSYNDASFRQAASEMEEMEAQHLASLPPAEAGRRPHQNGKSYLGRGLMLEAEREFQLALAANMNDADAHAGLAEVRRRNGDNAQARDEAQASLKLRPNAAAWLTLARLDRTEHQLPAAREDVSHALDVDPGTPMPAVCSSRSTPRPLRQPPHQNHESPSRCRRSHIAAVVRAVRRPRAAAKPVVVVLRLQDTIQPISEDYFNRALDHAADIKADALLIELEHPGGLLSTTRNMVGRIGASPVPVIVYVAPEGARAGSAGFFLLEAADIAAMAPGTNAGASHPVVEGAKIDDTMKQKLENDTAALLALLYRAARPQSQGRRRRRPQLQVLHRAGSEGSRPHRPHRARHAMPC